MTGIFTRVLTLFLCLMSFPAFADTGLEDPAEAQGDMTFSFTPVPEIKSNTSDFFIRLRGRVQLDHLWIDDGDNTINLNATRFRTARMGVTGQFSKKLAFNAEIDFRGGRISFRDVSLTWRPGPVVVRAGHIKFSAPSENSSSSRFTPLMERGGYNTAFGFGRQFGVAVIKNIGEGFIMAGVAQGGFRRAGKGSSSQGLKIAARIVHPIKFEGGAVHLGASFRYREIGDLQGNTRYSARAFQAIAPRFTNTTNIADGDLFFGLESAVVSGSFAVFGEMGFLNADLAAPIPGQGDPTFWGGHITTTYFFTGENNTFNTRNGTYGRPKPIKPVLKGGIGAIEGVVRYDFVDLVDNGFFGGQQRTIIVGINWWWTDQIRWVFNYSHSNISQAFLVPANGLDGANTVNTFGIRTQIDW